ncbi:hypothetical protein GGR56DRAFT_674977 [Xylariaceae sp. FL0804]|nr:hypothetical protein GGR56DRAFT_674977 [Xylariaceae sp. FL0804]
MEFMDDVSFSPSGLFTDASLFSPVDSLFSESAFSSSTATTTDEDPKVNSEADLDIPALFAINSTFVEPALQHSTVSAESGTPQFASPLFEHSELLFLDIDGRHASALAPRRSEEPVSPMSSVHEPPSPTTTTTTPAVARRRSRKHSNFPTSPPDALSSPGGSSPKRRGSAGGRGSSSSSGGGSGSGSFSSSSGSNKLGVRERNRIAAHRCRRKQKLNEDRLREDERELSQQHGCLAAYVLLLKNEVLELKNQILAHGSCDCEPIQTYITNSAKKLM